MASVVLVVGLYGNYIVTPAIQANHLTGACSTDNRQSLHENNILNKKNILSFNGNISVEANFVIED